MFRPITKNEQKKNYFTALFFLKSAMIGVGFLVLPSITIQSGVLLSFFLLLIFLKASLFVSIFIKENKNFNNTSRVSVF